MSPEVIDLDASRKRIEYHAMIVQTSRCLSAIARCIYAYDYDL